MFEKKHWNRGAIEYLDILMEGMVDCCLWKIRGDLLELELELSPFYLAIHEEFLR